MVESVFEEGFDLADNGCVVLTGTQFAGCYDFAVFADGSQGFIESFFVGVSTEGVSGGCESDVFGWWGGDDAEVEVGLAEGVGVGELGEFGGGVVVDGDCAV